MSQECHGNVTGMSMGVCRQKRKEKKKNKERNAGASRRGMGTWVRGRGETYVFEFVGGVLEPALGEERIGLDEVACAVVRRVLRDVHDGAPWNVSAGDAGAAFGGGAREPHGDGGVVAQGLLQDGGGVLEGLDGGEGDVVGGGEAGADLVGELCVRGGALQEEVGRAGEQGGGCLAAGGEQRPRVGYHFGLAQGLVADALVADHRGEEVEARGVACKSLVHLLR
jgi:hypothetical protein